MKQTVHANCVICHRHERWLVEENTIAERTVMLDGGSRRPKEHPQLAAWNALRTVQRDKTLRVIEPCAACGMPMAAKQSRQVPMDWPIDVHGVTYFVGPERTMGPEGPVDNDTLNTLLQDAYRQRFEAKSLVSPTAWFRVALLSIFVAIFFAWLTSAFCLSQFYLGIYEQGLTGP